MDEEKESESQVNEEVAAETEEPAEEVTAAQTNDEGTDLFCLDLDSEEVSSTQIKEWKANGLMQADYTRKTQELADSRKDFETSQEEFNAKQVGFDEKLVEINAIIKDETLSAEQLEEMWEYEPEKVKAYQERQVRLKALVGEASKVNPTKAVDMAKVSADLFANHPEWMVDGKNSKKFTEDTNLMTSYAESRGIGQNELSAFEARHFEIMLDAARYQSINKKNVAIEKKVRMAPVTTKPRAKANNGIQSEIDIVQKRFNQTGSDKDFLQLRRLQRQLK